jgi:hypothetical protein
MVLTPEDIERMEELKLKSQSRAVQQLQIANALGSQSNEDMSSMNWELTIDKDVVELQHIIASDIRTIDERGSQIWVENPNKDELTFNKNGVRLFIEQIRIHTTKTTILSNYTEERIKQICFTIGSKINDYVFVNAEYLGLDTPSKQAKYPLIIMSVMAFI